MKRLHATPLFVAVTLMALSGTPALGADSQEGSVAALASQVEQSCEVGLAKARQDAQSSSGPGAEPWGSITSHLDPKAYCGCLREGIRSTVPPELTQPGKEQEAGKLVQATALKCGLEGFRTAFPDMCPMWIERVEIPPMPATASSKQKSAACGCVTAVIHSASQDTLTKIMNQSLAYQAGSDPSSPALPLSLPSIRATCLRKVGIAK
jgi:hypothetical protein